MFRFSLSLHCIYGTISFLAALTKIELYNVHKVIINGFHYSVVWSCPFGAPGSCSAISSLINTHSLLLFYKKLPSLINGAAQI